MDDNIEVVRENGPRTKESVMRGIDVKVTGVKALVRFAEVS